PDRASDARAATKMLARFFISRLLFCTLPDNYRAHHLRSWIKPRLPRLFDDEGGRRVEMRGGDAGGAGEGLHRGQDAVDLGRAVALEILQHRGFVRRTGPPAVSPLDGDLGRDAVRPRRGEPLF